MYGWVIQAVMEKLLIVWTCYMLVAFLNTTGERNAFTRRREEAKSDCKCKTSFKNWKTLPRKPNGEDHNQWYSQFKRLTNQGKTDKIIVEEISHLADSEQAEQIADHISAVSQEYDPLKTEDIEVPKFNQSTTPHISVEEVLEGLMNIKKSSARGDIPAKLIKRAAMFLATPLADVINSGIRLGQWPYIYWRS